MACKLCAFCNEAFDQSGRQRTCSPVCRKAHNAREKAAWNAVPENKARKLEGERMRRRDPAYLARKAEMERVRRSDPVYRDGMNKRARERQATPEARAKRAEWQRMVRATPKGRAYYAANARKRRDEDREFRERQNALALVNYYKRKANPEARAREVERARQWYVSRVAADPEYREKCERQSAIREAEGLTAIRMMQAKGVWGPIPKKLRSVAMSTAIRIYRQILAGEMPSLPEPI